MDRKIAGSKTASAKSSMKNKNNSVPFFKMNGTSLGPRNHCHNANNRQRRQHFEKYLKPMESALLFLHLHVPPTVCNRGQHKLRVAAASELLEPARRNSSRRKDNVESHDGKFSEGGAVARIYSIQTWTQLSVCMSVCNKWTVLRRMTLVIRPSSSSIQ